MDWDIVEKHYLDETVQREIADYCRGRWVAIEGGVMGSRVFLRYRKDGRPLAINDNEDLKEIVRHFKGVGLRSIYGSVNVYRNISSKSSLEEPTNIAYTSPIWDIDGELSDWRGILEVARIIVDELERLGIAKSVFIKWSGEGAHVHVNERCFSNDILSKHNSLDIAYSLVGLVLDRSRGKITDVISRFRSIKVENEIDLKRVFTAPLSLHRRRNLCCVCFKPEEIDCFEIEWANPEKFRHNCMWRDHVEGEGDEAATEAIKAIGGYKRWPSLASGSIRTVISASEVAEVKNGLPEFNAGKIGRFQVMGLLQAARYYLLTGDLERAKSFGLNRAIFYAWAKRHGKEIASRRPLSSGGKSIKNNLGVEETIQVGDEVAFISKNGLFIMGNEEQRPEDYDKQIAKQIDGTVDYERAWQAALEYLKNFGRDVLLSQQKFFKQVYQPVRDKFLEDIILNLKYKGGKSKDLTRWFQ